MDILGTIPAAEPQLFDDEEYGRNPNHVAADLDSDCDEENPPVVRINGKWVRRDVAAQVAAIPSFNQDEIERNRANGCYDWESDYDDGYMPFARVPGTTPAADALVATVELLGNILSRLPYDQLQRNKTVSKHFKTVIDTAPEIQKAMFLRPGNGLPQAILEDCHKGGKVANVEHRGQPLYMLSHYEKMGGLVFGGIATNYMTHSPPALYPNGSTWLFVRQAFGTYDDTPNKGSWRNLLLKADGSAMDFDLVMCSDEQFIKSIHAVFVGGQRTLGGLVDAIREEFEEAGLSMY